MNIKDNLNDVLVFI